VNHILGGGFENNRVDGWRSMVEELRRTEDMLKDRLKANNQPHRLNIHTRGTDESIYLRKHKVHQVFPEILAF